MLLKSKHIAFLGLLAAISVILVVLSGIIEFNTLFLLGVASLCIGIAIQETGLALGFGFLIATVLLSIILAPNKLYCITYAGIGLYIVITEVFRRRVLKKELEPKMFQCQLWVVKVIGFNLIFIPILFGMPKLVYAGEVSIKIGVLLILLGQVVLIIYDKVYSVCMEYYIRVLQKKFQLNR